MSPPTTSKLKGEKELLHLTLHNDYYDLVRMNKIVNDKDYQMGSITGGSWEKMGILQIKMLISKFKLNPYHHVLDIGCGDLRGGIKIMKYLQPKYYHGLDMTKGLIDKGIEYATNNGLADKIDKENFVSNKIFDFSHFQEYLYQYAISMSVFTHLPISMLSICMKKLEKKVILDGGFVFSFYENTKNSSGPVVQHGKNGSFTTYPNRAPYHYKVSDIVACCQGTPWCPTFIGDWGHPDNEKLMLLQFNPWA